MKKKPKVSNANVFSAAVADQKILDINLDISLRILPQAVQVLFKK